MVHHHQRLRLAPQDAQQAADLLRPHHLGRDQEIAHARGRHHLGLAHLGHADADRAGRDLAAGDLGALVGLGVGAELLAGRLARGRPSSRCCARSDRGPAAARGWGSRRVSWRGEHTTRRDRLPRPPGRVSGERARHPLVRKACTRRCARSSPERLAISVAIARACCTTSRSPSRPKASPAASTPSSEPCRRGPEQGGQIDAPGPALRDRGRAGGAAEAEGRVADRDHARPSVSDVRGGVGLPPGAWAAGALPRARACVHRLEVSAQSAAAASALGMTGSATAVVRRNSRSSATCVRCVMGASLAGRHPPGRQAPAHASGQVLENRPEASRNRCRRTGMTPDAGRMPDAGAAAPAASAPTPMYDWAALSPWVALISSALLCLWPLAAFAQDINPDRPDLTTSAELVPAGSAAGRDRPRVRARPRRRRAHPAADHHPGGTARRPVERARGLAGGRALRVAARRPRRERQRRLHARPQVPPLRPAEGGGGPLWP